MKPVQSLLHASEGLLDRVLCVLGAVIFSQAPEFMQQYLQRLGGHLAEAQRHLAQFRHSAELSGLTLDRLITQTSTNADAAVAKLGAVMTNAVTRAEDLAAAESALRHASLWSRPYVFITHLDPAIAHATWSVYQPAVPTTTEGFVYALCGILVFLGIYYLGVKYPIGRAWAKRKLPTPTGVKRKG